MAKGDAVGDGCRPSPSRPTTPSDFAANAAKFDGLLAPRKPSPLGAAFRPSPSRPTTPSDFAANAAKFDGLLARGEVRVA